MTKLTTEEALEVLQEVCFEKDSKERLATLMAIDALSTQMPKKPLVIKHDEDVKIGAVTWKAGVPVYQCSHCNRFITRSNDFCSKCGQAIDWSDKNV